MALMLKDHNCVVHTSAPPDNGEDMNDSDQMSTPGDQGTPGDGPDSSGQDVSERGGEFPCPNCQKIFRREDLLRRHMAREARARAQPSLDRQKSCYECARSKARCDLEVPECGRCRKKGKKCEYAPRSGNPNVRKARQSTSTAGFWPENAAPYTASGGQGLTAHASGSAYDSDSSRRSSSNSHYAAPRSMSQSSSSTNGAAEPLPYNAMHSAMPAPPYPPAMALGPKPELHAFPHGPVPAQPQAPFGKRATSSIMTSFDRGTRLYDMEDGEETPISRMVSSFTQREGFEMQVDQPSNRPEHPQQPPASHRSLPPLMTNVRVPGMGSASLRTALQVPNALDLSGWLDEPVMPSPLYRLGPYSALKTAGPFSFALPGMEVSDGGAALRAPGPPTATPSASVEQVSKQTQASAAPNAPIQAPPSAAPNQGAARHIWEHGIREADDLSETLARAAAAHLITYPTLMVLPEPTSPVPPFIFRPWLASVRSDLPASLAVARVVLAGYIVRLPSSQSLVWESIARELRILTDNVESALAADDLAIFASTAALWLYLVLAILTEEPAGSVFVDDALVNAGLKALSQLATSLSVRIKAAEAQTQELTVVGFSRWGLLETMRRTLFAAYTILILQRFREGALEIQQHLAGCDLIMDVALPCSANMFEAANEEDFRSRRQEEPPNGRLTLRDLIAARRTNGQIPDNLVTFFNRHDEFTNVCLSVALGLDSDAM